MPTDTTRREFLSSATVTLLLIPLTDCTSSSTPTGGAPKLDAGGFAEGGVAPDAAAADAGADAGPAVPGCNGVGEVSTSAPDPTAGNQQHTHTLCVLATDLSNPPAGGVTYDTSLSLSHVHTVTLTQAQLQTINGGGTVMVISSNVSMHTHAFTIVKM